MPNGLAAAPVDAPPQVQNAIWSANELQTLPYKYGGGHRRFIDKGYDCSGTVSWALHFAGLLDSPLDSSSFMHWGERGPGQWFTVYTNPGHAFVIIAGLRLDTSAAGVTAAVAKKIPTANESGPRWRPTARSTRGYRARHPLGWGFSGTEGVQREDWPGGRRARPRTLTPDAPVIVARRDSMDPGLS